MNSETSYRQILSDYSNKVQNLFSSPNDLMEERSFKGPISFEELEEQAEDLIGISDRLNQAAVVELNQALPEKRAQHGTSLMAKSLIDLEISAVLLEAAVDQEAKQLFRSRSDEQERQARFKGQVDILLEWMDHDRLAGSIDGNIHTERIFEESSDPVSSRFALQGAVEDGLDLITSRAGRLSQDVIFGLINIEGIILPSILNNLNTNLSGIAEIVEPGKKLLELYQAYITRSITSLLQFVGPQATEEFVGEVISWVNPLKNGKLMTPILESLFGVSQTEERIIHLITSSQRDLRFFQLAAREIDLLLNEHYRQIQIGERINSGLGILGSISSALVFPVGGALLAAGKLVLGAFIVTASGDYLDAPNLKLLNRVAGIPSLVESRLGISVPGEQVQG